MRVSPRLVASARMVASSAFSLSQGSPVRRLVKAVQKPVDNREVYREGQ
jgi:hypothetical protein